MYMPYLMCGYAATILLMLAGCMVMSRTVPGLRGLRLLVYALLCGLLGVLLMGFRPVGPGWMTIALANEALFACALLLYRATTNILAVRDRFLPLGIVILLAAPAALQYFTYIHEDLPSRIYICSACFAIMAAARAVVLFAHKEPAADHAAPASAQRFLVVALGWLQVSIVILQVLRIVLSAVYPPRDIVHMDPIQSGFTYLNLVLNAGGGFGLTWLAMSMHRRDLHRIAQTDGMTGLLNRRAFEEILARELHSLYRAGKPLSVLMIDIDRFKEVNDTWGHQAGDVVIRRVAWALQSSLRPGDALSRFGGEEFVILLRDTTTEQSEEVAGRLRAQIAGLADLPGSIRLTVSIGVAAGRFMDTPEELLRRCDAAMYLSKKGGRNLVTVDESLPGRAGAAPFEAPA